jgi:DNA invertase Pin-like site-specific DNA recombinase
MTDKLQLDGDGAAYIRTSEDDQNEDRQLSNIKRFLAEHKVTLPQSYWFIDKGWARDTADERPEFQRLLGLAERGVIKWIVVSERDRFGTADADEFVHYRFLLRKWGCKLIDVNGTDWTRKDIATVITAVVEGEKSEQEQRGISTRVLSGMADYAKDGQWMGNARVRLGFDVACFARADQNKELWRVVLEGKNRRLKVYPDGRSERFDGRKNFPPHLGGKKHAYLELLRLVPSQDEKKIKAVQSIFLRYATEAVTLGKLAHYLNDLGFRTCTGERFQSNTVEDMFTDPAYLGHPLWNRGHRGKFHSFKSGKAVQDEIPGKKKYKRHAEADWIRSQRRLFPALVPLDVFNAVAEKLANRDRQAKSPTTERHSLSRLLYCSKCNKPMVAAGTAASPFACYICGTYQRYAKAKDGHHSPCRRHPVFQYEVEPFIEQYLVEAGKRLDLLLNPKPTDNVQTSMMERMELDAWRGFTAGLHRLIDYLAQHHPDDYARIVEEDRQRHEALRHPLRPLTAEQLAEVLAEVDYTRPLPPPTAADAGAFVADLLGAYSANFDAAKVAAEVAKLEAEENDLMKKWADLPTARTKALAKEQLQELEQRIEELKSQQQDAAAVVEGHYREMRTLQASIRAARREAKSGEGERAVRRRAEALRKVIWKITCRFVATGVKGGGFRKRGTRLASVTIEPLIGEGVTYQAKKPSIPALHGLPYKT